MTPFQRFVLLQARVIHKYALAIVIAFALITIAVFPTASRLTLKANFIDLLPADMPSVLNLEKLTKEVGGTSYLIAAIESPDEDAAREATRLFAEDAAGFEDVDSIDNRTSVPAFTSRKLLFLTLESLEKVDKHIHDLVGFHRRKNNPFYIDLLDEPAPELDIASLELDEKVYRVGGFAGKEAESYLRVILLKPKHPVSDFVSSERLYDAAAASFEKIQASLGHALTIGYTGPYKTRYDEYHVIMQDLKRTGILTVILIGALLIFFFRNLRSPLLGSALLGIGILWTCAFTQWAIGYLNLITAFLLAILFGLGISFAIHLLVRYEEERKDTSEPLVALERTFAEVAEPLLTSALTTSIAFFSLTISRFYGFKHFGIIAGGGILICFLAIFYGLPSCIMLAEKFYRPKQRLRSLATSWGHPKALPIYVILIAGLLFSVFSVVQAKQLKFEFNFAELQAEGSESIIYADRIGKHFGVVLNPVVLMTPNRKHARVLTEKINAYIDKNPDSTFDFAAYLLSHVPKEQDKKIELLSEIDVYLEGRKDFLEGLEDSEKEAVNELRQQLRAKPLLLEDVPEGIRNQYEGKDRNVSSVYVYPKSSLLDGSMAKRFTRELRSLELDDKVIIAGEPVIYADILMLLDKDTGRAMMISLTLVVLLLFLHFRRVQHVAWVLSPVVMGFLWLGGLAALTGFRFNYLNVTILPSILGVGIDSGVHIFHRYKNENKSTLFEIMHKTGLAVILSLLTTMAAFGSLCVARHRGMSSVGELGLLGFAACLLTSVIFIPAVIEFLSLKYWNVFRQEKPSGA